MATDKQFEANRLNALKSTGPISVEGKSKTRFNALKHGVYAEEPVIIGENSGRFQEFRDSYFLHYQPAEPQEETLLSSVVRSAWLLDRLSKVECHLWDASLQTPSSNTISDAYAESHKQLDYLQRRLNSAHRNYRADLELLTKLQAARKKLGHGANDAPLAPAPSLQPTPQPESPEAVATEIGFVPPGHDTTGANRKKPRNPEPCPRFLRRPDPGGLRRKAFDARLKQDRDPGLTDDNDDEDAEDDRLLV